LEISTTKSTVGHGTTSHPSSSLKSWTDRTIDILSQIQQDILAAEAQILIATDTIAELDCLLAFATASRDLQLHRPQMVTENVIRIQQGRHLLYEMTTDMYIANDTLLVGGSAEGAPAQQGKSLVRQAKQVAVAAFLPFHPSADDSCLFEWIGKDSICETGRFDLLHGTNRVVRQMYLTACMNPRNNLRTCSFVPAAAATLGPVDKIYTRLQTKESTAKVRAKGIPSRHPLTTRHFRRPLHS
jgi:DNA mismatch repair protein MSH5